MIAGVRTDGVQERRVGDGAHTRWTRTHAGDKMLLQQRALLLHAYARRTLPASLPRFLLTDRQSALMPVAGTRIHALASPQYMAASGSAALVPIFVRHVIRLPPITVKQRQKTLRNSWIFT